jgi:hypothetical protein
VTLQCGSQLLLIELPCAPAVHIFMWHCEDLLLSMTGLAEWTKRGHSERHTAMLLCATLTELGICCLSSSKMPQILTHTSIVQNVAFKVLISVVMDVAVFWGIVPCSVCEPTYRLHPGGPPATLWFLAQLIFDPEDGDDKFLQNVSSRIDCTLLYPTREPWGHQGISITELKETQTGGSSVLNI